MAGLLSILQVAAYSAGPAYVGWLVGNHQCPAHHNFYLWMYSPVAAETLGGLLSGLRGAPYHGNIIARLFCETPEDDHVDFKALPLGVQGSAVGAASGLAVSLSAYSAAMTLGEIVNRIF